MPNTKLTPTRLQLHIPINHACFADHFPGAPLVPGALLLKWIMALIANEYDCQINYLKQIKFLSIVRPGDVVQLHITPGNSAQQFTLDAYLDETLIIKGQFECAHD